MSQSYATSYAPAQQCLV